MRLIDADYVFSHLKPYEPSDEEWSVTGGTALRLIHNAVDNAPTVDAVPVVRCKDCQHRGTIYCPAVNETIGNWLVDYTSDEAYCWCGRPKGYTNAV
nr:MAG TPA: baseplate protein [Caudoviricetes sp.]